MKQPGFWQTGGWKAVALAPLGGLYAWLTARRVARQPRHRSRAFVISVGNLNVGGTGKTPTVIALIQLLDRAGLSVHVVSRGYGGSEVGPLQVDPDVHTSAQVGDEPLLLSAFAPVWVAKDRVLGALAAEMAGVDVILLDDAHQNPDLFKDLSIVVVDAEVGFGNGRPMPAGPLRETPSAGLMRADLVLTIGSDELGDAFLAKWGREIDCTFTKATIEPLEMGIDWQGLRVLAFAGIARPEKFYASLSRAGADIIGMTSLDDHQEIPDALFNRLLNDADKGQAQLVTTEKDAVRLGKAARGKFLTFPVRLRFSDPDVILALLPKSD